MPLSIQHFSSLEAALARIKEDSPDSSVFRYQPGEDFEWVPGCDGNTGRQAYRPAELLSSPYLYRGQVRRHTPCRPSVFREIHPANSPRDLPLRDRALLLLMRVRLEEFCLALKQHPAYLHSEKIGLEVNPHALAQHYELPTDRLDLTQDPNVAAFFASNRRTDLNRWEPVNEGVGVIYRVKVDPMAGYLPASRTWPLESVGNQALPRPAEQRAWTVHMSLGACLEDWPVDVFAFHHDGGTGKKVNASFNGGIKLFPRDVMFEIAQTITSASSIPQELLIAALKSYGYSQRMIRNEIKSWISLLSEHCAVRIEQRDVIRLSQEQILIASSELKATTDRFIAGVRPFRTVSKEEMEYFRLHDKLSTPRSV